MAIRNVIIDDSEPLHRVCRPYDTFNDRLGELLDDMGETMMVHNGVGLAAPQVGILRRCCVVLETNVKEDEEEYIIELVNPEIIASSGTQTGPEGCLSYPEVYGEVTRPNHVRVRAQNRHGEFFEVEGDGLTARAFCHEIDHLNGRVFEDIANHIYTPEEMKEMYGED